MFNDTARTPRRGGAPLRACYLLVAVAAAFILFVGSAVLVTAASSPAQPSTASVTGTLDQAALNRILG